MTWARDTEALARGPCVHGRVCGRRLKESLVEALAARDMSLECEDTFIDIESPADKAIQLLNKFLEGQEVRGVVWCGRGVVHGNT